MEVLKVNLKKGFMDIYNFGNIKLHCYQTNDLMNDESYILENSENVLLVEFPAFYDNLEKFENYVRGLNKNIVGKVFSDHPNGGTILKDVDTKIAYLEELKKLAKESKDVNDFENRVKARYPEYSGLNYLDMTAGFFFPQK